MKKRHRIECLMVALLAWMVFCAVVAPTAAEAKKLMVVTSTTDMAALAQEVGGDRIEVESIAKGYQDPHFVEAKPSFLLKLRHADLLINVGLQLEIGWLPPLITQSGNPRIQMGAPGNLDASQICGNPGDTAGHGNTRRRRRPPARESSLLARPGQWAADCTWNCK